jgi:hypothetical protein
MQRTKHTALLTILLVAMLAIAGCGGGEDPTPTPAPSSSEAAPVEPASGATPVEATTNSDDTTESTTTDAAAPSTGNAAIDAVAAALRNQIESLPMRMTMTTGAEGEMMTAEVASPDRFHINASDTELLMVDGTFYIRNGDTWIANDAMASIASAIIGQFLPEAIEEQIAAIGSAEQLPDEEVNGEPASVYLFTVTSPIGDVGNNTSKVYIRKSDGLPIRLTDADDTEESFSIDYEYDPSIVIEAPQ